MYVRIYDYTHIYTCVKYSYFSNYVGSTLSKCTFNGQQCCGVQTLSLLDIFVRPAVENYAFNFDSAFQGARNAIDQLTNETGGMYAYTYIYIHIHICTYVCACIL